MAVAVLLLSLILLLIFYLYHVVTTAHSHWIRKGIKGPKPHPIFGNFRTWIWTKEHSLHMLIDHIYKDYQSEKVVGIYEGLTPALIIRDPEIIKTVLIKDFCNFTDKGIRIGNDPITNYLFEADGDVWRALRQRLTPVFTTGKLKGMIPLVNSCVEQLMDHVDNLIDKDNVSPKDIRVIMTKFTLKSITSIAFGLDVNTFAEEPTEFEKMAKLHFLATGRRRLIYLLQEWNRDFMNIFHLRFHSSDVLNFFRKLVSEIIKEREGKPKVRKDFIDLLIELKERGRITSKKDGGFVDVDITDDLITAQAITFYGGGFDTTSGTLSYLLYELARNPDIQKRCCEEIDNAMAKYDGKLDYDSIKDLKYLSMVLDETLRKYPVGSTLFRECVEDYTCKDINLTIKKGTKLLIPPLSLQRDPKYYPDPEKFDPKRFSPENKDKGNDCYLPFGAGPRTCIAFRFALIQSLLCMAKFLHRFRVRTCNKTPEEIAFEPEIFTLAPTTSIWLDIQKRNTIPCES